MVRVHIYAEADESDSLLLETHALLESVLATEQDLAA